MLIPTMRSARDRYLEARAPKVSMVRALSMGLLLGTAAGFLLGVIMAPASGRVTRSRFKRRVGQMQDSIRESADELSDAGRNLAEATAQNVKTSVQDKLRERGIARPQKPEETEGEGEKQG